ncbi:hypothetical protein, partial [Nonomuraea sp. NPDC005501]|uniref:hypothetical protein n=1 Tax=Nonomuraea sp. NPDC005501 TaxID=3156884 RepID=UPI0033BEE7C8
MRRRWASIAPILLLSLLLVPSLPAQAASSHVTPAATAAAPATWSPPANLVTPLNQVWQHVESTYSNLYGFRNYGWDQVMANKGSINYCVRWDSTATV